MEFWKWWIPDQFMPGKLRQSWRMTEADAQAQFPGCRKVDGSRLVVREGTGATPTAGQCPTALVEDDRGVKKPPGAA